MWFLEVSREDDGGSIVGADSIDNRRRSATVFFFLLKYLLYPWEDEYSTLRLEYCRILPLYYITLEATNGGNKRFMKPRS